MELYKKFHKQLNAYCIAISNNNDDAKDLMSNAVEIAYIKFTSLKEKEKFKYFLFGIASNLVNNERRKMASKLFFNTDILEYKTNISDNADASIDIYYLKKALASLSNIVRDAVVLFELQGFSIKEISQIQNANENTIKTRISRGREQLKKILNPQNNVTIKTKINYGTR